MGAHGHEPPYKVPDHSIFTIQGVPQLQELEKKLAEKGLKDPWIRNEAWRYHPGFGTKLGRFTAVIFRGFLVGAALTAATVAYDTAVGGGSHQHHDDH